MSNLCNLYMNNLCGNCDKNKHVISLYYIIQRYCIILQYNIVI